MNQRAELLATQIYLTALTHWPGESSLLQSLGTNPQTIAIPVKHLNPIPSPIGEYEQVPGQRVSFELLHDQAVKPVEAAAQIHRRGGDQYPRCAGETQHGSACNNSGKDCTSEAFCSRTIQPCGLTTSTGQRAAGLRNRTS